MSVALKSEINNLILQSGYTYSVNEKKCRENMAMIEIFHSMIEATIFLEKQNSEIRLEPVLGRPINKIPVIDLKPICDFYSCQNYSSLGELPVKKVSDLKELIEHLSKLVGTEIPIKIAERSGSDVLLQQALIRAKELLMKKIKDHLMYCYDLEGSERLAEKIISKLKSLDTVSAIEQMTKSCIAQMDRQIKKEKIFSELYDQKNYGRIQKAKKMLMQGMGGMQIRDKLNFTSEFNLYKTFRKYTGVTTREFVVVYKQILMQFNQLDDSEEQKDED